MRLSPEEKARVKAVKEILIGFRPGRRVIVARNNPGTRGMKGVLIEYGKGKGYRGWQVRLDGGHTQFYYQKNLDLL